MTQLTQLDKAIMIATKAHSGDLDKGGKPYIFHPFRVAMNVDKVREYPAFKHVTDEIVEKVRCACILHDTVEDTKNKPNPVTFDTLRAEGIEEDIIEGVDGMTRREGETYREFIERAMLDIISRMGKACDLLDNMDESRLKHCSADVRKAAKDRIEKRYKPALKRILGEDGQELFDLIIDLHKEDKDPIITNEEIASFIAGYVENTLDLTLKQSKAITMALQSNVSLLAGTAGSGVTATLKAIIRCLKNANPDAKIHVFSGTGKSRLALSQRLDIEVNSIYQTEEGIITGDLLLIHQPQMMNKQSLHQLLKKCHNIRVLLVGDFKQLPMQDGVSLNELVSKTCIPVTNLTEMFRQVHP